MNISHTLIVALLFVTILSFGLVNILSAFASVLNRNTNTKASTIHLHWIAILLILHFNMAWSAILITSKEVWTYDAFLFIVLGPIMAFFASSIIMPGSVESDDSEGLFSQYLTISKQFFILFVLIQIWAIGTDFMLQGGITGSSILNVLLTALGLVLLNAKQPRMHRLGLVVAWGIYLSAIVLRGLEIIH